MNVLGFLRQSSEYQRQFADFTKEENYRILQIITQEEYI